MIHEEFRRSIIGTANQMTAPAVSRYDWLLIVFACHVERSRDISLWQFRAMSRDYNFWVYIVTNRNHSVLYIGVANRLSRRTWEHHRGTSEGFAAKYQCKKLIYYEHSRDVREAIARELQLKRWSRAKKTSLINRLNPTMGGSWC